ncbi:hypothetical protein GWI33_006923 [Rhynchophorus ferrugineus]|uniref:Uncharacterized protein n=1 Tax=Rhynchophorus ferrugineus TaxID=354439 RepID=A0A834II66_RHYFE|nr:hypothetical protein GWI33_006923 [Rhynchophorus ferrugineus]
MLIVLIIYTETFRWLPDNFHSRSNWRNDSMDSVVPDQRTASGGRTHDAQPPVWDHYHASHQIFPNVSDLSRLRDN